MAKSEVVPLRGMDKTPYTAAASCLDSFLQAYAPRNALSPRVLFVQAEPVEEAPCRCSRCRTVQSPDASGK
jgi:hypothetical protein